MGEEKQVDRITTELTNLHLSSGGIHPTGPYSAGAGGSGGAHLASACALNPAAQFTAPSQHARGAQHRHRARNLMGSRQADAIEQEMGGTPLVP
jgi:hypothetical protein